MDKYQTYKIFRIRVAYKGCPAGAPALGRGVSSLRSELSSSCHASRKVPYSQVNTPVVSVLLHHPIFTLWANSLTSRPDYKYHQHLLSYYLLSLFLSGPRWLASCRSSLQPQGPGTSRGALVWFFRFKAIQGTKDFWFGTGPCNCSRIWFLDSGFRYPVWIGGAACGRQGQSRDSLNGQLDMGRGWVLHLTLVEDVKTWYWQLFRCSAEMERQGFWRI